jgi:transcriptional regulator with XRE-family HTH domain
MAAAPKGEVSLFEWNIRRGAGIDLYRLRTDAGLAMEEAGKQIGVEVRAVINNYEKGAKNISLDRYLQLAGIYLARGPSNQAWHPAADLLNDKALRFPLESISTGNVMLYTYLAIMHGQVLAKKLPASDPAEQLFRRLVKIGSV